jgi:site-specific DNA-methyltransferase (adenine-specific)
MKGLREMKPYYQNELTTIYNGDCLEVMDYLIAQGVKVDAIITDPPYGTTACSWDNVIPFDKMWPRLKLLRKDKTPIVLFGSEPFSSHLRTSNIKEFKYDWIWNKKISGNPLLAKHQPLKTHEIISLFYGHNYYPLMLKGEMRKKGGGTSKLLNMEMSSSYNDEYYPNTIITYSNASRGEHPTQKPLELMKYLIETYTKKGDLILDFTAGSFTTCVAAEQLNRRSIGIELEKKYCDVGVKRLSQLQMRLDI